MVGVRKLNSRIILPFGSPPLNEQLVRRHVIFLLVMTTGWSTGRGNRPQGCIFSSANHAISADDLFYTPTRCVHGFFSLAKPIFFSTGGSVYGGGGSFLVSIRIKWKAERPRTLSNFRRRCRRCWTTADAIVLKPKTFIIV